MLISRGRPYWVNLLQPGWFLTNRSRGHTNQPKMEYDGEKCNVMHTENIWLS